MGIGVQESKKLSSMTKVTEDLPSVSVPLNYPSECSVHIFLQISKASGVR